ncbi:MAG: hypothetical protein HFG04_07930 [Oscillibacter sp.]|nr:hypothetical protein [Oscillibacter sp.]MCI9003109.1 hypothetical protein [Oscillibacter sp.]
MKGFPLMTVDVDSYLVGAEIQTKLNFDPLPGRHCIAMGKVCATADKITFMIDLDHDYASVAQNDPQCLVESYTMVDLPRRARRKGTIIIQNDVWVGHGATIMNGVTLHNGCVVAADSVVTKDVPPYAVVGGNPARVLKYRFDPEIIDALQRIAWWDWPDEALRERKMDFFLPPAEFVAKYLPLADNPPPPRGHSPGGPGGRAGNRPLCAGRGEQVAPVSQRAGGVFHEGPPSRGTAAVPAGGSLEAGVSPAPGRGPEPVRGPGQLCHPPNRRHPGRTPALPVRGLLRHHPEPTDGGPDLSGGPLSGKDPLWNRHPAFPRTPGREPEGRCLKWRSHLFASRT